MTVSTLAGTVSTLMFVASMLPMLVRAARTKDLASYSRSHLALSSVGNLVHSIYVVTLPVGPIWVLHGFYLVAMGQMLVWHVRHEAAGDRRPQEAHVSERILQPSLPARARRCKTPRRPLADHPSPVCRP